MLFSSSKLLVICLSNWKLDPCLHAFLAWLSPNSPRSPSPHRAYPRDGSPNGRNDNKHTPNGRYY